MRVAIISPWYVANGGAERVDAILKGMYPAADIFTLFFKRTGLPAGFEESEIRASFLHRIPFIAQVYRPLLSLFPYAVESFDLRGYDLIISSDWAMVKGVIPDMEAKHICYCHSPMQHIWDRYREYAEELPTWQQPFYALTTARLRQFDFQAAQRVDQYVANSRYIGRRISHYYRRDSTVIYPPVETGRGYISESIGDYYLSVGRLNRTKRIDLLVHACNRLKRKLVISGWGPEEQALKAIAGPTIEFVGRVPDDELRSLYANCRALLFAANEDFGIVPVEAQSYGRPVVALGCGGALETVRVNAPDGRSDTGVYFSKQSVDSLIEAIHEFENREGDFSPQEIREHATSFDSSEFKTRFRHLVDEVMSPASSSYSPREVMSVV